MADIVTTIVVLASVFLFAMLVRLIVKGRKKLVQGREPLQLTVITRCRSCPKKSIEPFKEGDYLLKSCGKCKCGGQIRIIKIYTDEKTPQERKWKAYEKRFEV